MKRETGTDNSFIRAAARIFLLITFVFISFSCIDRDFLNVQTGNDLRWRPDLSIPLGEGNLSVNSFFSHYSLPDTFPGDTFPVYFEDSLYYLADEYITDTVNVAFSMSNLSDQRDNIEYLSIRTAVKNGFPTECKTQVYLVDGSQVIDSLLPGNFTLEPAAVNEAGQVVERSFTKLDIPCDSLRINRLYAADHMHILLTIKTTHEALPQVQFYERYVSNIQIGIQAGLTIDADDF